MKRSKLTGTIIATAVAGLFIAGKSFATDQPAKEAKEAKVKCMGANECKGKGMCKSTENACSGKNGCKGKGVIEVKDEKECSSKGGKVMAENHAK